MMLFAGGSLLVLIITADAIQTLWHDYHAAIQRASVNMRNVSLVVEAQTANISLSVETTLADIEEALKAEKYQEHGGDVVNQLVRRRQMQFPFLLGLFVLDKNGNVTHYSESIPRPTGNFSDRPFFQVPQQLAASAVYISPVIVSRVDGKRFVAFARRLVGDDGQFNGVVVARVDPQYFESLYQLLDLGPSGLISLFNRDGVLLMRGPNYPGAVGKSFRSMPLFATELPRSNSGIIETTSLIDGHQRIFAYRALEHVPLVILTGVDRADVLRPWFTQLRNTFVTLTVFVLMIFVLIFLLWRELMRQQTLLETLQQSEKAVLKAKNYLDQIINTVGNPIFVKNKLHQMMMVNDAFLRFFGYERKQVLENPYAVLFPGHQAQIPDTGNGHSTVAYQDHVYLNGQDHIAEEYMLDASGQEHTVIVRRSLLKEEGGDYVIVGIMTDITERKRSETRLKYLAECDTLTGLPNRNLFTERIARVLELAQSNNHTLGVLLLDLDRFKEVNDSLGHHMGDLALKYVAERLVATMGSSECLARLGGDEFVILVKDVQRSEEIDLIAQKIIDLLDEPVSVDGVEFFLGASIGVSLYPLDASNVDDLIRVADIAMYRAKAEGRNTFRHYSRDMQAAADQLLRMERRLRRALERNEFYLVFQPQINLRNGKMLGVEALLRWNNPELGLVSPSTFIPLAEETGLINTIGAWVLHQACEQVQRWIVQNGVEIPVAVNLSARQFRQKNLVDIVRHVLIVTCLPAYLLELEITESVIMNDPDGAIQIMNELCALGIRFAIDDFGTGYSSLAYLKRFPVSRLKIDRSFVNDLSIDADDAAIVTAVIALGHSLKLSVLAEGVETLEQMEFLRALACDEFQGFYFSRPVCPDKIPALIQHSV